MTVRGAHRPGRSLLLAAVLLGALGVMIIAACGGPSWGGAAGSGPATTPRQGGTYDYPLSIDAHPFDPGLNQYDGGNAVLHQMYEGLVRWELQSDGTLKTSPCLAERWSANADCTVWTFVLRRGVMFQAPVSREVTAADVVADLRYLADPASVRVMDLFVPEEKVEAGTEMTIMLRDIAGTDDNGLARPKTLGVKAIGRHTVRFTLKRPFSEFPVTLGGQAFWVWPEDYRQKVGAEAYAAHPVGTGPYMFLQRARGRSIDLARNPQWWDTSGGPYIDRIHYQVYDSVDDVLLAFRQGFIDWTPVSPGKAEGSKTLPEVESGRWAAESGPLLATYFIEVSMEDPVVGGGRGSPIREALTSGCDRQALIDGALDGGGLAATGLVPPGIPGSQLARSPYAYDAAGAADLFEQAGSPPLQLAYPTPWMRHVGENLPASYEDAGISITPRGMGQEPFWTQRAEGKLQLVSLGWGADYPSMDDFLYPLFHTGAPDNYTSYSNPEVDDLLDRARATPDAQARMQLYAEAERLILADAPVVPLYVPTESRLLSNKVANVNFDPLGWVDLWRAWMR